MRKPSWVVFGTLTVVVALWAGVSGHALLATEGSEPTWQRLTRGEPMMPLREPTVEEFLQEADTAPYAAIDPTAAMDLSQVPDTQISVFNTRLLVAYTDGIPNQQVKLWYDDGRGGGVAGDALASGGEIRVVDALPAFAMFSTGAVSAREVNGLVAVTYGACGTIGGGGLGCGGEELKLWYDDGRGGGTAGDVVVNGGELRPLTTAFHAGGEILEHNGRLLVLWKDSSFLRLWADDGSGAGTDGDGLVNGSEVRTLNVAADPEIGNGKTLTNIGGDLVVAYWKPDVQPNAALRVWVDDGAGAGGVAGDLVVNGTEDRELDSYDSPPAWWSSAAWVAGKLAVSFKLAGGTQDLAVWYDDGGTDGAGVAGDLSFNDTEMRQLVRLGNVGEFSDIAVLDARLAVTTQYILPPQLKMFYDDGNDRGIADDFAALGGIPGQEDPPEARGIDQPLGGGGFGASVAVYDPDPGDPSLCEQLAVAHLNQCDTCGYQNDLALHLTTVSPLAPRALFIHDTGDHQFHDPVATEESIDLTLRWFEDGSDMGEVFISGDVTGPNAEVWLPLVENVFAWPDFMTLPVDLVPGAGEKTLFMSFRNGACSGNTTVRTVTLVGPEIPDPTNLTLATGTVSDAVLNWDDVVFGDLDGYHVYRAAGLPGGWTLLTGAPVPTGTTTYTDPSAALGASGQIFYYYVTAVDTLGNESSNPPN